MTIAMMRSSLYFLGLAATQLIAAEQVGYFESDDCADPEGFVSCYEDADSWYNDCINDTCEGQNVDCHNSCDYAKQASYTRCQVGHCWNMVYTCEYQLQAADSVNSGINPDLERVPFFPPPDNADGRCSCNIGNYVEIQVKVNDVVSQCGDAADPFSQSADEIEAFGMGCLCCGVSGMLSTLDSTCPKLDPAELEVEDYEQILVESLPGIDWPSCQEYLDQHDCAADFGFPTQISSYYGPGSIPTGGTETLYNIGALTTPVSKTVTFTIAGTVFPVTAVSTDSSSAPTDLSNGDGNGSDSSDNNASDSDSSNNDDNSDESDSNSQADSDNADSNSNSEDVPEDAAARPSAMSMTLALLVAGTLGLTYAL